MKSQYKVEDERPAYDATITEWLSHQNDDNDMMNYCIGLHHAGYIYRSITCRGLGEYVEATTFLNEIGLANALAEDARYKGYDALFAPTEEVKKLPGKNT